uniref:Sugar transporter SWEET n=1 Tax=Haptolina brevifila TaxID=156173 RepID=A0A7S2C5U8_9EUKA
MNASSLTQALPKLLGRSGRPKASLVAAGSVRSITTSLARQSSRLSGCLPLPMQCSPAAPRRGLSGVIEPLMTLSTAVQEPAAAMALSDLLTPGPLLEQTLTVLPPVLLQFVFFSPLPAVREFHRTGTTGDVSIMPYSMMVANGTLWFTYGALLGNPTIMVPNITAIVMGIGYCSVFWRNRSPQAQPLPYLVGSGGLCAVTVGAAVALPLAEAQNFIGYLGCAVCVGMFSGPLASMSVILRDRSAASIPLGFTLFSTLNTTTWLAYGALVLHDPFIWGPNVLGLASSVAQIGLIARFGTAAPQAPRLS